MGYHLAKNRKIADKFDTYFQNITKNLQMKTLTSIY